MGDTTVVTERTGDYLDPVHTLSLRRLFAPILVLGLAAAGCGDDDGDDPMSMDASADAGPVIRADTGDDPVDAGFVDSGLHPDAEPPPPDYDYGMKLAEVPANLIGVTPDESEVVFTQRVQSRDRIFAIDPAGGMPQEILSEPTHIVYTESDPANLGVITTRPIMWMMTNLLRVIGDHGKIRTYRPGVGTLTTVTGTSAKDVISISPDAEWAVATDDFRIERQGVTSTRTADLVLLSADGSEYHRLMDDANMGEWDDREYEFIGRCATSIAWTSSTSAAIVVCPNDTKVPTLYMLDLPSRAMTQVQTNVTRFLSVNPAHTFFFWQEQAGRIFVSDPALQTRVPLTDTSTVRRVMHLDDRRFAINNTDDQLKISSYPELVNYPLLDFGVEALRRASPGGDFVMFSQNLDFISDMFLIPTATGAMAMFSVLEMRMWSYPGDDAFSPDGDRVYWYKETNPNLIGDINTRVSGSRGPDVELVRQAYWVFNYANPDRVLLMMNSEQISSQTIISDLATRAKDGSDELETLAGNLVVAPRDFLIFPTTRRIAYHVPTGDNAGIWIRDLP